MYWRSSGIDPTMRTWANSVSLWLLSKRLSCEDRTTTRLLEHNRTVMSLVWGPHWVTQDHRNTIWVDIYSGRKQVLSSWGCAELCRVLLCCAARYRDSEREQKRNGLKGKWSIQDASCQWSRIHKHTRTHSLTHTRAHTSGEFLMSEDLTGHRGGRQTEREKGRR